MADINTHGLRIGFGKHGPKDGKPGELFTRLPCSYLRWMVNNATRDVEIAKAELERRGMSDLPEIEVSGHAVDNASLRCRRAWHDDRSGDEGIHSWVTRVATEVLSSGRDLGDNRRLHERIRVIFVFDMSLAVPILKTVYLPSRKPKNQPTKEESC